MRYKYASSPPVPNQLILFITSLCNFSCETCFYWEKLNDTKNDLSYEELEKISNNFDDIRILLLTGGEPYLRKDFFGIIKLFYNNNNVRKIHLPTNGYATKNIISITRRMLTELPDLEINIGISLDAVGDKHDLISGKKGAFNKAIETQYALIKLEDEFSALATRFYTVASSNNVSDVAELLDFIASEFGYERIGISPLRGVPADGDVTSPSVSQWDEVIKIYNHYVPRSNSTIRQFLIDNKVKFIADINRRIIASNDVKPAGEHNFGSIECSAGNNICVIDADGAVRVCELKDPVGNLRDHDYDIRNILNIRHRHSCTCTHACFQNASIDVSPINYIRQFTGL